MSLISKLKIGLGEYEAMPRDERVRFVIREVARSLSVVSRSQGGHW